MNLIIIVFSIILLPTILIALSPLIDKILTQEVVDIINNIVGYIETIIGSNGTIILFGTIGIIIVMPIIRRFFSFFTGENDNK